MELIKGQIYSTSWDGTKHLHIFKYLSGSLEECNNTGCIQLSLLSFNTLTRYFSDGYLYNIRLATPEEAEHLEQCIQAGKYVEYKKQELPKKWKLKCKTREEEKIFIEWVEANKQTTSNYRRQDLTCLLFHYPAVNGNIHTASYTYTEYIEITFDQFKRLVLKENTNMKKKIIAYKLKKEMPFVDIGSLFTFNEEEEIWEHKYKEDTDDYEEFMYSYSPEEIVNTDWFTPVYEEDFKAGDYVVIEQKDNQFLYSYIGKCVKVLDKSYGTPENCINVDIPHNSDGSFRVRLVNIRKATPEEIKAAQEIKIDKYIVEFPSKYSVKIGCNIFTKNEVHQLLQLMSKSNSSIDAIRAESIIVTKEQIQEIYNKFE